MILLLNTERHRQSGATHASEVHGRLARSLEAAPAVLMTVPSCDPLTERELDVLELLEARLSTREIAACLAISVPAIEWHATNAYRKLRLSDRGPADREALTPHELVVLRLLVGRLTVREIAHELDVSPFTVKRHTIGLYQKLQVQNGRQAVARARTLGLLPVGSGVEQRLETERARARVYLLRSRRDAESTLVTNMLSRPEASSPPGGASPAATVAPPVRVDRPTETTSSRGDIDMACVR